VNDQKQFFFILAFLAFTGMYIIPVSWNMMKAGEEREVTITIIRIRYHSRLGELFTDIWVQHKDEGPPVYEDIRLIGRVQFGLQRTYKLTLVSRVAFYGYDVWYDVTEYLQIET
jgi:hypothetical protein